jgi:hypothetical protein
VWFDCCVLKRGSPLWLFLLVCGNKSRATQLLLFPLRYCASATVAIYFLSRRVSKRRWNSNREPRQSLFYPLWSVNHNLPAVVCGGSRQMTVILRGAPLNCSRLCLSNVRIVFRCLVSEVWKHYLQNKVFLGIVDEHWQRNRNLDILYILSSSFCNVSEESGNIWTTFCKNMLVES